MLETGRSPPGARNPMLELKKVLKGQLVIAAAATVLCGGAGIYSAVRDKREQDKFFDAKLAKLPSRLTENRVKELIDEQTGPRFKQLEQRMDRVEQRLDSLQKNVEERFDRLERIVRGSRQFNSSTASPKVQ